MTVLALAPQPWEDDALCREYPELPWVPERGQPIAEARAVCGRCMVRDECLGFALDQGPSLPGVWGGTTFKERRRMLARRDYS